MFLVWPKIFPQSKTGVKPQSTKDSDPLRMPRGPSKLVKAGERGPTIAKIKEETVGSSVDEHKGGASTPVSSPKVKIKRKTLKELEAEGRAKRAKSRKEEEEEK